MRDDQLVRLKDLEERLVEVVLADADPQNWAGAGQFLMDMDKVTRGDAAWCRKTAVQSVALTMQVRRLITDANAPKLPGDATEPDPESAIEAAERAAAKLLERMSGGPGKQR